MYFKRDSECEVGAIHSKYFDLDFDFDLEQYIVNGDFLRKFSFSAVSLTSNCIIPAIAMTLKDLVCISISRAGLAILRCFRKIKENFTCIR